MNEVSLERRTELQKLYLKNMQEIKWRVEAIDEIYLGKKTTRFFPTNIEFCVLQIRKVLELIALSALVNRDETNNPIAVEATAVINVVIKSSRNGCVIIPSSGKPTITLNTPVIIAL